MNIRNRKHLLLWGIGALIAVAALAAGYVSLYRFLREPVIHVAVVAPLRGPNALNGRDMVKGIRLYLEKVYRENLLPNTRIALLTYDDEDDPRKARDIAREISEETDTVLVIGHFSEDTALAAAPVYKQYRLPAITASAALEEITTGNDWYFRIFQTSSFQAAFIANYIKYVFKRQNVSLISDSSRYGQSLARHFERSARSIGLDISMTAELSADGGGLRGQLDELAERLARLEEPGMLFLAMRHAEAVAVISALQSSDTRYAIIGPDSFATSAMRDTLKRLTDDAGKRPGAYSDGIYALSPFMIETANHQAQVLKARYEETYPGEPLSWVSANYYDAMAVAVDAIAASPLEGAGHTRGDRRTIRDALTGYYDDTTAFQGVTGTISFDSDGNAEHHPVLGFFQHQRLLPTATQYQVGSVRSENRFERVLRGELMVINERQLLQTQVVYTDIAISHIGSIDVRNPRYTLEFYVWFRFRHEFDDADIVFANAVSPISPGAPIFEQVGPDLTTRVYHVTAEFTKKFDFRKYPFDEQVLPISFRHKTLQQEHLMYVPDPFGPPPMVPQDSHDDASIPNDLEGWKISRIQTSQDVISQRSSLGNPGYFTQEHTIEASQFSVNIRLKRSDITFYVRAFFPMLLLLIGFGAGWSAFSVEHVRLRVATFGTLLLVTAFYHIWSLFELPEEYLLPLDYAYFLMYGLLAAALYSTVSGYALYRRRLRFVRHIDLFSVFPDSMKSQLCKRMRRRRLKTPESILIRQGEEGDALFLLIEGAAEARQESEDGRIVPIRQFSPGELIGETALLTGERHAASVLTTTPAVVRVISRADIAPFLAKHPDVIPIMGRKLADSHLHAMEQNAAESAPCPDVHALADEYAYNIRKYFEVS